MTDVRGHWEIHEFNGDDHEVRKTVDSLIEGGELMRRFERRYGCPVAERVESWLQRYGEPSRVGDVMVWR